MKKMLIILVTLILFYTFDSYLNYQDRQALLESGFEYSGTGFFTSSTDESFTAVTSPFIPRVFTVNWNSQNNYNSPLITLWVGRSNPFGRIEYYFITDDGACEVNDTFDTLISDDIFCLDTFSDMSEYTDQVEDYKSVYKDNVLFSLDY